MHTESFQSYCVRPILQDTVGSVKGKPIISTIFSGFYPPWFRVLYPFNELVVHGP